jgi:hypothetical protein
MKKLILTLALVALAASGFAQANYPVSGNVSSDTAGSVAMLIKYVGTTAGSATTDVAVAAGGDMSFRVAGVASTTVNTAAGGAVCGAVVGTLDLSTPAGTCDTLGEVVDVINSSSDWRAVLVSGLRSDSSDNTLTTFAVSAAQRAEGIPVYFDSGVSLTTSIAMIPESCKTDIRCFMTPSGQLLSNPHAAQTTELRWLAGFSTYATTGTFQIFSVKVLNKAGVSSEVVTTMWSEAAGASGTNKALTQFQYFGLLAKPGEKMICRILNTGASSAYFMQAYGVQKPIQ